MLLSYIPEIELSSTYIEYSGSYGASDRIAAERVEVTRFAENRGDLRCRYDYSHGKSIANSFGHRHDIRHDTVTFEAPEVFARPADCRLHLVGYAETTSFSHELVNFTQKRLRVLHDPADTLKIRLISH